MSQQLPTPERLDSWKAIADYLQRDQATVRRWEKGLGLPVRRVAGTGRSVFAYTSEIDEWLQASKTVVPGPDATAVPVAAAPRPWIGLTMAVLVLALVAGLLARSQPGVETDLQIEATGAGIVARDTAGVEQWRYAFPVTYQTVVPRSPVLVTGGRSPGVYFATSYRGRQIEDRMESGALSLLDLRGRLQHSFSFDNEVTFQGTVYGGPWALSAFAVDDSRTPHRVAVAAHHYTWDPGLVTILDERWQQRGTFVHAGWIEVVRWVAPNRLLIGGFSNAHDGGMVALLDGDALDGQGPEPAGSRHHCESCGTGGPLRMFVLPRSEVNLASNSRFNRVLVDTGAGRVSVRTIEMSSDNGDADALYEFTPSLDLLSARFSERYWELHMGLEAEGKIAHTREHCPDRDGPRSVKVWNPSAGWQTLAVSQTSSAG